MSAYDGRPATSRPIVLNFSDLDVHEQWRHRPAGDAARARQPPLASGCSPSACPTTTAQIFELTRLDEAIGIHDTEADALAAAGAA